jgi:lipid-A-disaccharide synthase-like uncharacterized protein
VFEVLGIIGIAISVAAYVPQVVHLGREHCSAGVSSRAWAMWLAGGALVGALAVHRRDPVFMMLQASSLTSAGLILFLARRYRGMLCANHSRAYGRDNATTVVRTITHRHRREDVPALALPLDSGRLSRSGASPLLRRPSRSHPLTRREDR